MTHTVGTELLAVYLSNNAKIKAKMFQSLEAKYCLASVILLSRQAAGKFVSIKKRKVEHFVNRLENGKTTCNMLEANTEKCVCGCKKLL